MISSHWMLRASMLLPGLLAAQIHVQTKPLNRLAPPVSSPLNVVDRMLEIAEIRPGDHVYDLGSGDGRVVLAAAQKFGAQAIGVEISPKEVKLSREKIAAAKLEDRCRIIEADMLAVDLSQADVVTIYLLTSSNDLLRPNLEHYLRPGTRVISHDYPIRGWQPLKVEKVEAYKRTHHLYLYEMPPKKTE